MLELGAGKRFILLSGRFDTVFDKCCSRDMRDQVWGNLIYPEEEEGRRRENDSRGERRASGQKEEQAQKAARLDCKYCAFRELHADQDY